MATTDRRYDSEGHEICAKCRIRLLRVEKWTGDTCYWCRKEAAR